MRSKLRLAGRSCSVVSSRSTPEATHIREPARGTAPRQPAAQKNASRLPRTRQSTADHIPRDTPEEPETKTRQCAKPCRELCIQNALAPSLSQRPRKRTAGVVS